MTTTKIKWYRRNYLIDYRPQIKLIGLLALITFIFTLAICLVSYDWLLQMKPIFTDMVVGPMRPESSFDRIVDILIFRLVGLMVVMFIFFISAGIVLTHRLTGPIWKLRRDLKKFFDGEDVGDIGFRKADEFQDLPELINRLMKGYRDSKRK